MSSPSFPIGVALVGVVFFGVMAIWNFVKAYRKKEKFFYGSGAASLTIVAVCILLFFGQYLLAIILMILSIIVAAVMYPKAMKITEREITKQASAR